MEKIDNPAAAGLTEKTRYDIFVVILFIVIFFLTILIALDALTKGNISPSGTLFAIVIIAMEIQIMVLTMVVINRK